MGVVGEEVPGLELSVAERSCVASVECAVGDVAAVAAVVAVVAVVVEPVGW